VALLSWPKHYGLVSRRSAHARAAAGPEKAFGNALREIRRANGMTQRSLSDISGYDVSFISLLERGLESPTLRTIFDLATSLSVPIAELMKHTSDDRKLHLVCRATPAGSLQVAADNFLVAAGQTIETDGLSLPWEAVLVIGSRKGEEESSIRVLICHPEWDQPLQIALIRMASKSGGGKPRLDCDLTHVAG